MPKEYEIREAQVYDLGGKPMAGWIVVDVTIDLDGKGSRPVVATVIDKEFLPTITQMLR